MYYLVRIFYLFSQAVNRVLDVFQQIQLSKTRLIQAGAYFDI